MIFYRNNYEIAFQRKENTATASYRGRTPIFSSGKVYTIDGDRWLVVNYVASSYVPDVINVNFRLVYDSPDEDQS